ncbi:MAG: tryptophan--tRNA ligase [Ignavibacteria bacterium]|nr:tryptophan--tRNA ligase [Ignavibacteria bacterium]
MTKKHVLSGMRPTGKLHIGHYVGALENWIGLQEKYQNYHLIADYHVLTTNLNTENIYQDSLDMVIDWVACGIDPERSPIFRQSQIKEHCELQLIFSMLITVSRLERNPSLKDQVRDLDIETVIFGHLGYPVLQAADILLYKGSFVPVGEDQVPHVEITREIARRFNTQYGEVFPEPEPLLTKFSRLAGLDGKAKMSKSLDNTILLSDDPEMVKKRLKKAVTDPEKIYKNSPGHPDICLVYGYHKKFTPDQEEVKQIEADCRAGSLGCVDCKMRCAANISTVLAPILEKRRELENNMPLVKEILHDGETKARRLAVETMGQVREKMKLG